MTTYSTKAVPDPPLECHDCGETADVLIVADAVEDATGYRDELALCRKCIEARTNPFVDPDQRFTEKEIAHALDLAKRHGWKRV